MVLDKSNHGNAVVYAKRSSGGSYFEQASLQLYVQNSSYTRD